MEEQDLIVISEKEAGVRLDKLLSSRFEERFSRTYFEHLIENELVLLNGLPVKKRIKPKAGDEIEIYFSATQHIDLTPEPIPLSILYEDDFLIAVDKPAGMVVHPAPGNWSHTFVNALLYHCAHLECETDSPRPGIVHRLDKDTSGVLIAAKTLLSQQKLSALFASRQVTKEYIAICCGCPTEGEINQPIGRHPIHRKEMAIVPSGKPAISHITVLKKSNLFSFVKISIATGRTHQIRVHLKYAKAPILGDPVYGNISWNKQYSVSRQLLHAAYLRLIHPITGQLLEIHAPLPDDMNFEQAIKIPKR